ncbi:hypothetical protein NE237_019963 [Protea cynaroides]|uniref:Cell morphogenesis central region domain-containing protein n=1 Tax=Protea cynaroides TaxID=273540 RepID=A0A9Q0H863_9MAGN|nr:hypothetical protein NE237_019963 [Protea cynaroides]
MRVPTVADQFQEALSSAAANNKEVLLMTSKQIGIEYYGREFVANMSGSLMGVWASTGSLCSRHVYSGDYLIDTPNSGEDALHSGNVVDGLMLESFNQHCSGTSNTH